MPVRNRRRGVRQPNPASAILRLWQNCGPDSPAVPAHGTAPSATTNDGLSNAGSQPASCGVRRPDRVRLGRLTPRHGTQGSSGAGAHRRFGRRWNWGGNPLIPRSILHSARAMARRRRRRNGIQQAIQAAGRKATGGRNEISPNSRFEARPRVASRSTRGSASQHNPVKSGNPVPKGSPDSLRRILWIGPGSQAVTMVTIPVRGSLRGWYTPCIQCGSWGGSKPLNRRKSRWHVVLAGRSSW